MSLNVGPGISARRVVVSGSSSTALLVSDPDRQRVFNVDAHKKNTEVTGTLLVENPADPKTALSVGYSGGVFKQNAGIQQIGSESTMTSVGATVEEPSVVIRISADENTFTDITSQFSDPEAFVQLFTAEDETVAFGFDSNRITSLMWFAEHTASGVVEVAPGTFLPLLGNFDFSIKIGFSGINIGTPFYVTSIPNIGYNAPVIMGTAIPVGVSGALDGKSANSWILVRLLTMTGSILETTVRGVKGLGSGTIFPGLTRMSVGMRALSASQQMLPTGGTGGTTVAWSGMVPVSFPGNALSNPGEYVDFRSIIPVTVDPSRQMEINANLCNLTGVGGSASFRYDVTVFMTGSTMKAVSSPPTADQYTYSNVEGVNIDSEMMGKLSMRLRDFPMNFLFSETDIYEISVRITLTASSIPVVFTNAVFRFWDSAQ